MNRPRPRILRIAAGLAAAFSVAVAADGARAQRQVLDSLLTTDLSSHLIAITSDFTGTELLLFGATEQAGDIVVVVRGPAGPVVVRRKARVAGIWLNRDSVEFENVPGYYAVASSRPLTEIASPGLLTRLQIGTAHLSFPTRSAKHETKAAEYRESIIRLKSEQNLYQQSTDSVVFLGRKLFRTQVAFPSTVPVGTYRAEVYLIRDDRVIAAQATPLFVDKEGVGQTVYEFAHTQPLAYGLIAVIAAMAAGWLAATMFRKN